MVELIYDPFSMVIETDGQTERSEVISKFSQAPLSDFAELDKHVKKSKICKFSLRCVVFRGTAKEAEIELFAFDKKFGVHWSVQFDRHLFVKSKIDWVCNAQPQELLCAT